MLTSPPSETGPGSCPPMHSFGLDQPCGGQGRIRFSGIIFDTTHGRGSFDDGYENDYRKFQSSSSVQSLDHEAEERIHRSQSHDMKYNSDFQSNKKRKNNRGRNQPYSPRRYSCLTEKEDSSNDSTESWDNAPVNTQVVGYGNRRKPRYQRKYSNSSQDAPPPPSAEDAIKFKQSGSQSLPVQIVPEGFKPPVLEWTPDYQSKK